MITQKSYTSWCNITSCMARKKSPFIEFYFFFLRLNHCSVTQNFWFSYTQFTLIFNVILILQSISCRVKSWNICSGSIFSLVLVWLPLLFNKHNRIKNPNWQEAASWLFTSAAKDFNSGQPRTNPVSARSGTRTRIAGLGVRRADHSATLPHLGMVNVSVQ